jgi:hypothetical protein
MSRDDGQVLCWPRRVLSADDLRRHLNGQRELRLLPRTVVTPLAADELKARGVRVSWQDATANGATPTAGTWGYAQERPDAVVDSVVRALERDGIHLAALRLATALPHAWPQEIGATLARSEYSGVVAFCTDAGLVCCVANKLSGVRAVPVGSVAQASKARASLGANLLAIEVPGPTFFELRQIVRAACKAGACPENIAAALKELDGHAHR